MFNVSCELLVTTKWNLQRLRDGSIDAAYVGSSVSPEQVAEEEGFRLLAWEEVITERAHPK
jgi:hypothetical protein